jgi:hypothetical protein
VERSIAEVGEAEHRVRGLYERAARTEERMTEAAAEVTRVAEWESRITDAARVEAEAARRISDAERRILGLVNEPHDPPSGEGI